ncbi:putative metalloprotease [Sphingobacterium sp. JUb56]|nr:putative metalloprotease [Sphingobacterium sp. JUb56]
MTEFKELIGQKVEKLYLIIWPPFGEQEGSVTQTVSLDN